MKFFAELEVKIVRQMQLKSEKRRNIKCFLGACEGGELRMIAQSPSYFIFPCKGKAFSFKQYHGKLIFGNNNCCIPLLCLVLLNFRYFPVEYPYNTVDKAESKRFVGVLDRGVLGPRVLFDGLFPRLFPFPGSSSRRFFPRLGRGFPVTSRFSRGPGKSRKKKLSCVTFCYSCGCER